MKFQTNKTYTDYLALGTLSHDELKFVKSVYDAVEAMAFMIKQINKMEHQMEEDELKVAGMHRAAIKGASQAVSNSLVDLRGRRK